MSKKSYTEKEMLEVIEILKKAGIEVIPEKRKPKNGRFSGIIGKIKKQP